MSDDVQAAIERVRGAVLWAWNDGDDDHRPDFELIVAELERYRDALYFVVTHPRATPRTKIAIAQGALSEEGR